MVAPVCKVLAISSQQVVVCACERARDTIVAGGKEGCSITMRAPEPKATDYATVVVFIPSKVDNRNHCKVCWVVDVSDDAIRLEAQSNGAHAVDAQPFRTVVLQTAPSTPLPSQSVSQSAPHAACA